MEERSLSYGLYKACEYKGQLLRVCRHLPIVGDSVKRRRYGAQKIMGVEEGRAVLKAAVETGNPFMAARFGTSEGATLSYYWKNKLQGNEPVFPDLYMNMMCNNAGFFPRDHEALRRWCETETQACADLDLLGVMQFMNEEWVARSLCPQAQLMPNSGLASAAHGWAPVLEGRTVLVVHPFTDTIKSQYQNHREEIFPGTNALPLFDLKCVKAVQTIADQEDSRFASWFDALDYMTEEIAKQTFDVALLGCGAYGFMLASRVKQMGKVAVHMGGSLQTLFGIKGARWDARHSDMYNDAWVYPSEAEKPKGYEKVEGGCYWESNH